MRMAGQHLEFKIYGMDCARRLQFSRTMWASCWYADNLAFDCSRAK